jgi:mono/diheme cytochrome c family protein
LKILVAVSCLGAGQARAQDEGRVIAEKWCAGCHAVGPIAGKTASDGGAPSFYDVAQMKSTTAPALTVFLSTPHGGMPDYSLTRQEIRDVSAYILSLRK